MTDPLTHTFGFEAVAPGERRRRIREVFTRVAPRYDLMNDVMSFGIHRLWKRVLAWRADERPDGIAVDLAGGTGDVARLLAARGPGRTVVVLDSSLAMMTEGRGGYCRLGGEGEALPLADGSVDLVTIAFGIRNMTSLDGSLAEVRRVLKPGGLFLCLEFSRPQAWFRPLYDLYSFLVIPRLGAWVAGQPSAYAYLVESIRRFPDQKEMAGHLEASGLERVGWRNLSLGIACLHWGYRPK
ncbi:MAG: class I SAM-dependent methyltransferase [Magnetospirillum sp. WYHS-4]